jgi:hypothetical protein
MKMQLRRFLGTICLLFFLGNSYAENLNYKCPCQPKPPQFNAAALDLQQDAVSGYDCFY